jgi:hypothetical protein
MSQHEKGLKQIEDAGALKCSKGYILSLADVPSLSTMTLNGAPASVQYRSTIQTNVRVG